MCFLISDFTSEAQLLGVSDHFDHLHHLLSKPPSEKESNRQVQHPSDNIKIHRKEGVGRERGREREREKDLLEHTVPCGQLYNPGKAGYKYFFLYYYFKENITSVHSCSRLLFIKQKLCCPLQEEKVLGILCAEALPRNDKKAAFYGILPGPHTATHSPVV